MLLNFFNPGSNFEWIKDIWRNRAWCWCDAVSNIPQWLKLEVENLFLNDDIHDVVAWGHESNGIYTTSFTYRWLARARSSVVFNKGRGSWVWPLQIPENIKHFLGLCGSSEESILHLLRDYPKAIHVWDLFQLDVHGNPPEDGVSIWIKKHATNISGSLFVATTWWVGKTRNKEVFRQTCIYSRSCPSQQNFIAPQYHSEGLLPFDFFSPC
ncbi:hypothetical protein JHK85_011072 [Glycine max]|nr:hypothetical protein JHK85_011072 [Glycine max]KAG5067030.1 hypothetical protein JHK86_010761 [Glycine max]